MSIRFGLLLIAALSPGLLPAPARASVVMTGTRVIYPGDAREKTLQFTNQDDHPNLVQVWVDKRDVRSTVETADGPFVQMPWIFRMEPHAGQMVRLVFAGDALPQDRESVFYLNFSQIPAIRREDLEANKLVLMFGNRLKIFYRPPQLPGLPGELPDRMRFTRQGSGLGQQVVVDNPTAYHAVVRSASLGAGGMPCILASAVLVPPLSQVRWNVPAGCIGHPHASHLKLVLVNDFGADTTSEVLLQ